MAVWGLVGPAWHASEVALAVEMQHHLPGRAVGSVSMMDLRDPVAGNRCTYVQDSLLDSALLGRGEPLL